jgi:hypothetical protein
MEIEAAGAHRLDKDASPALQVQVRFKLRIASQIGHHHHRHRKV